MISRKTSYWLAVRAAKKDGWLVLGESSYRYLKRNPAWLDKIKNEFGHVAGPELLDLVSGYHHLHILKTARTCVVVVQINAVTGICSSLEPKPIE